jgi:heme-degrading monooxygenase HmoA
MYVAMNHFNVNPERGADFEEMWRGRESRLQTVPGFVQFALLKGETAGDYISHTTWESKEAFLGWAQSDAFRAAHAGDGPPVGVVLGHPQAHFYDAVIVESAGG